MPEYDFSKSLASLNEQQRQAVDALHGPVMVIAGAGTGKTQTIAVRIANILSTEQINPNNILCLTFTDNAAINMRQRLLTIIGPTAYSVRITTFHGFCNSVISDHPEVFSTTLGPRTPIDTLTQSEIIRGFLDLENSPSPLKPFAAPYFFEGKIISAISELKRENIRPARLLALLNYATSFVELSNPLYDELKTIRATASSEGKINDVLNRWLKLPLPAIHLTSLHLISSISSSLKPTELKQQLVSFFDKIANSIGKQKQLLAAYEYYQQHLNSRSLFDFDDMILEVISIFKQEPSILTEYQERYQFILVDEYQDSNASQNEIINLLVASQDQPNIFVVGDDDQSIYRFQGASVENLKVFVDRYHPQVVVLKNNYRSHRLILQSAESVINRNQNRIARYIENIDKSLTPLATFDPTPINLFAANTDHEEKYYLYQKIKSLIENGVSPPQIAILVRTNADAADLSDYLKSLHLPHLVDVGVNSLDSPTVIQLINIIRYLCHPDDDVLLSQILNYPYLKFKPTDLVRLYHAVKRKRPLSELIGDTQTLTTLNLSPNTIRRLKNFILKTTRLRQQGMVLPPDKFFRQVISEFKVTQYLLSLSDIPEIKLVSRLFDEIKNYSRQNHQLGLEGLSDRLGLLLTSGIELISSPPLSQQQQSIRLLTVHKAKGLEFDHVFLYRLNTGKWDNGRGQNGISLPLGVHATDVSAAITDDPLEDDRRLFYVALTRARKQIYLSYYKFKENLKEQLPTQFLAEIDSSLIETETTNSDLEAQSLISSLSPPAADYLNFDLRTYLLDYLDTAYRFNITHLNSYLSCPFCFLINNLLRLPKVKTKSLSLGTAVHGALAYLYNVLNRTGKLISEEKFLEIFKRNLNRESLTTFDFDEVYTHGSRLLSAYYHHYQGSFIPTAYVEKDFKRFNIRLDDIPLTGKIDQISLANGGVVTDYKTGTPENAVAKIKPGGEYYRQLVFYKLLCQQVKSLNLDPKTGVIDFIKPLKTGQYYRASLPLENGMVEDLKVEIKEVFAKIKSLEFPISPTCTDPDHLHYLKPQLLG